MLQHHHCLFPMSIPCKHVQRGGAAAFFLTFSIQEVWIYFWAELLRPTLACFPWSVTSFSQRYKGHLYLPYRNSQIKCVVSQWWGLSWGSGQLGFVGFLILDIWDYIGCTASIMSEGFSICRDLTHRLDVYGILSS